MTTPITLSTAHAMRRRSACVRLGLITLLLDDEKAGHVAEGLHRTAVAVDGARPAGDEALPVVDAGLAGFEREGDHVHASRGGGVADALQRYEDAEVGNCERVGGGRRIRDRAEVALLRVALVVEVVHVEVSAHDSLCLRPERVPQPSRTVSWSICTVIVEFAGTLR